MSSHLQIQDLTSHDPTKLINNPSCPKLDPFNFPPFYSHSMHKGPFLNKFIFPYAAKGARLRFKFKFIQHSLSLK